MKCKNVRVVEYYDNNDRMGRVHFPKRKNNNRLIPMKEMGDLQPIITITFNDGLRLAVVNNLTHPICWDGIFIPSKKTKGGQINTGDPMAYYAIESSNSVMTIKGHNHKGENNVMCPAIKYIKGGVIYTSKMYLI